MLGTQPEKTQFARALQPLQQWAGMVMTVAILSACSSEEESLPLIAPIVPAPTVTITAFSPTTARVGDQLSFTVSAQFLAPNGIPAADPVLVTVTPPLGERIPVVALDANQIPNCSAGNTSCTLDTVVVDASNLISLTLTGAYVVTVSLLDLQGQVGQDTQVIQVGL